jgi:hypothetical protein
MGSGGGDAHTLGWRGFRGPKEIPNMRCVQRFRSCAVKFEFFESLTEKELSLNRPSFAVGVRF